MNGDSVISKDDGSFSSPVCFFLVVSALGTGAHQCSAGLQHMPQTAGIHSEKREDVLFPNLFVLFSSL